MHKLAENEVVFHNQLYHPNVITRLAHYIDREKQVTYMILEYADGGTLFEKIKTEVLSKKEIKNYFRDVCEAIAYLHQNDIMHRDIKVVWDLLSLRIFFSQNKIKLNCVTLASQRSWARGKHYVVHTNICLLK